MIIGVARAGYKLIPAAQNIMHLENMIVRNDYFAAMNGSKAWMTAPEQASHHSVVLNAHVTGRLMPTTSDGADDSPRARRLVELILEATSSGIKVLLLCRGMSAITHMALWCEIPSSPPPFPQFGIGSPRLKMDIVYAPRPQFLAACIPNKSSSSYYDYVDPIAKAAGFKVPREGKFHSFFV